MVHAVCTHDCPDSCGVLVTVDTLTRARDEGAGRSGASGDAGIFVREGGAVSGPRVFAGAAAVSDAAEGRV